ncbi:MAG: glycosyltransferase family 2 protein [Candidatus Omnitrophica bacterium]|nr:glycosyltransferase family 2 protein [Candidatus Omnitrophota bacterium]
MIKRYLVAICTYNEGEKIKRVIKKFNDYDLYDVLIVDDGSSDDSLKYMPRNLPIEIIVNASQKGAGYATRQTIDYAKEKGYFGIIFVSGNDKEDPDDAAKLVEAIEEGYDFVQGSRYLPGGDYQKMPFYRIIATKWIHPFLFSMIAGMRITDSTNGFRAMRLSIMDNEHLDLNEQWLDQYELEPYLFYKVIELEYKVTEVPVKKIYPPKVQGYTKMKPFIGWWSILKPLIYIMFKVKK